MFSQNKYIPWFKKDSFFWKWGIGFIISRTWHSNFNLVGFLLCCKTNYLISISDTHYLTSMSHSYCTVSWSHCDWCNNNNCDRLFLHFLLLVYRFYFVWFVTNTLDDSVMWFNLVRFSLRFSLRSKQVSEEQIFINLLTLIICLYLKLRQIMTPRENYLG